MFFFWLWDIILCYALVHLLQATAELALGLQGAGGKGGVESLLWELGSSWCSWQCWAELGRPTGGRRVKKGSGGTQQCRALVHRAEGH